MEKLWRIRAEIEVKPGDLDLEPGYTRGFMNVVTWATSDQTAQSKLADYLNTFRWKVLGVEESGAITDAFARLYKESYGSIRLSNAPFRVAEFRDGLEL